MLDNEPLGDLAKIQTICRDKKIALIAVSTKDRNKAIAYLKSNKIFCDYIFSCDTLIDKLIDSIRSFYSIEDILILDNDALASDYWLAILVEATPNDTLYKVNDPIFNIIRPTIKKIERKIKTNMPLAIDNISSCNVDSIENDSIDFARYKLYRQNIETIEHNPEQINYNKFINMGLKQDVIQY